MNAWLSNSIKNIVPLSQSDDFSEACKEWFYFGECKDHRIAYETCEMCEHPNLRYHFLIENKLTENTLWVGSFCIKKFDIRAVDEDGDVLSFKETAEMLDRDIRWLIEETKKERVKEALNKLDSLSDYDYSGLWVYYLAHNTFTPSQLLMIFKGFYFKKITYDPADFKMSIKKDREREQLRNIKPWEVKNILWNAMSSSQKKWWLS